MNTADQWVLCWTQTKNTLHIESLETHLSLNCQSFVKNLSGDYRDLADRHARRSHAGHASGRQDH